MVSVIGGDVLTAAQSVPSLISILKTLPPDSLRRNLVCAFGRPQSEGEGAHPPIAAHQWLPGQWTPVLYGLSREWRVFARTVLTHSLTVDLAITVSLQRPAFGSGTGGLDFLDTFLAGFPCLQHLTLLAGNGGAPVDDSPRPNPDGADANGGGAGQPGLAMADVETVASAAQQLLRMDRAGARAGSSFTASHRSGPRLTTLELRLHPAVWRTLSDDELFLQRLAAAHPSLETLTLHIAGTATAPAPAADTVPSAAGVAVARVGVGSLAPLGNLTKLRLAGPIAVEGLTALTQLQSLSMEGVASYGGAGVLQLLPTLTSLRVCDSHLRPIPVATVNAKASASDAAAAACVLLQLRCNPSPSALRALRLPDVVVGYKDWALLVQLCPTLQELEVASVTPHRSRAARGADAGGASGAAAGVPDWFVRATTGDEVGYSTGSGAGTSTGSDGRVPSRTAARRSDGESSDSGADQDEDGGLAAARTTAAAGGCPFAHVIGSGAKNSVKSVGPRGHKSDVAGDGPVLRGLRRLMLWQYVAPWQLVQLLKVLPGLQELQASLLLDDPPDVPAAMLRPAAVAVLRPLVDALQPLRDVNLAVSCDPAAVTGQLAGVFLMDSGLAEVPGIRGLSLHVWVAAQIQLGALAVLSQLRSLELTLGKQEQVILLDSAPPLARDAQESELSVLTRLHRLSYLSLRITPGIWNEIQGRTGRVTAGAALRLAMSFGAGQQLLFVADVHREICEDEAISLVKSVEMATGQIGSAWAVSAWVEETAECIMGLGPSGGGSGTLGGNGGDGVVLRVVWTPELVRRLLAVAAGVEGASCGGLAVSFMGAEEERLGRVLGS
ncbi:hypothetical protein GPECTOR_2g1213 [Gonium pectorale]|uniref:Uncharacterized protein n=1 Tax=Gonium pectorale TaxID=33097 RepID=A0A150H0Y2_GONPE|nr:hypothetical protein GPECTOR_2g1213 [Gonium pectorale]|eukprot:KXZ55663.1 hypothetical protein GPECTOR_2g1213 [Gonium pectorale]